MIPEPLEMSQLRERVGTAGFPAECREAFKPIVEFVDRLQSEHAKHRDESKLKSQTISVRHDTINRLQTLLKEEQDSRRVLKECSDSALNLAELSLEKAQQILNEKRLVDQRVRELTAYALKYAHHLPQCSVNSPLMRLAFSECTCGFVENFNDMGFNVKDIPPSK